MFNTASVRLDAVYTAYLCKIGLFLVSWALSPVILAEAVPDTEISHLPAQSRISEGNRPSGRLLGPTVDRNPRPQRWVTTGAQFQQLRGHREPSAEQEFRSKICDSPSGGEGWQTHRVSGQGQTYCEGSGFARDSISWQETEFDSGSMRYWISKPTSSHYLVLAEYGNLDAFPMHSQNKGEGSAVLTNLEHWSNPAHIIKSPENRFRIETVYKRTLTQSSWLDRYANRYPGASYTIHQDFDAIFPAVEFIDKSLTAVYRPEGKMLSLRYEDRKGSSIYSEITLFF